MQTTITGGSSAQLLDFFSAMAADSKVREGP
jgi:hypothetical protein